MSIDLIIGPTHGADDTPAIAVILKLGTKSYRVEVDPADFALCLTGRMVKGRLTRDTLDLDEAAP